MKPRKNMRIDARASLAVGLVLALASPALAASDAGPPRKATDAGAPHAMLIDAGATSAQGSLPSGHPAVGSDATGDAQDDGEPDEPPANPHGGAASHDKSGMPGVFQPPADESTEDPTLPKGTIAIEIRDAEDKPMPKVSVTLGVVHQSVAKGESHEHFVRDADDKGEIVFSNLEASSSVAYRISCARGDAMFSATPFRLPDEKGERVVLHVYDATSDIQQALIVSQAVLYVELKDDRVQMEEAVTIFNFGKTAWVPKDVIFRLPETFTAFSGQQSMSAQGVDPVEKQGAKLHGTFPPGRGQIEFRWQLPYAGSSEVSFEAGMPPHLAAVRVMAVAADPMKFSVEGFPDPHPDVDGEGNHVLVVDKQLRANDPPIRALAISLRDIPTPGPARIIATAIASVAVLFGLYMVSRRRTRVRDRSGAKRERQRLLADLEELERARITGDVGPKTYERARRELIDAISRTLEPETITAKPT